MWDDAAQAHTLAERRSVPVVERGHHNVGTGTSLSPHIWGAYAQPIARDRVLMQHKGDRRVAIELQEPDLKLRIKLDINAQIKVRPSERLVADVEKICGAGSVSLR